MELTGPDLLCGAVYALEQAGYLLHDALFLFRKERYSSSVVLTVFSKEEMGRFEILLDIYYAVEEKGSKLSSLDVLKRCDDHLVKLRHSHYEDEIDLESLGRPELTEAIFKGPWSSIEHKQAWKKARELAERLARRMPKALHRRRMRALYVEPTENDWNRPIHTSREECLKLLRKTSDEYDARCSWYEVNETERSSFISTWAARPALLKSLCFELRLD